MTLKMSLLAASMITSFAAPAFGQAAPTVEGNVSLVSDYRFRGVSFSDETLALQGGLDASWESGFYIGTWGSSIEPVGDSELELDLYGGYAGTLAEGVSFDVGVLVYTFPGQTDTAYGEAYASLTALTGPAESTLGIAYAPEQDNLGDDDNVYLFYSGAIPLTETIGLDFGLGYESGAFGDLDGDGDDKLDWTLGVTLAAAGLDWGLAYVDTSEDVDDADAQVVLSVGRAF